MNSKICLILSTTLLVVMIMLTVFTVEVQAVRRINSNTNPAGITQGGRDNTNTTILSTGSATINMAGAIAAISFTDYIRIDNTTTTTTGWKVNVYASDFTATSVSDSSSAVAGATLSVAIPANTMLIVTPQAPTASGTASLTGVTAQNTSGIAVTNSPGVQVISAEDAPFCSGGGCGNDGGNANSPNYYLQQLNYTLTLPTYLPNTATISLAQADSQFTVANRTPGAKIGLFAATYGSTITYSMTTGP